MVKRVINVKVKPNSFSDSVEKVDELHYIVNVKEPAEDNKANKKVVNLLAREFNVNFRKIKIKNPTSRDKIIEIDE